MNYLNYLPEWLERNVSVQLMFQLIISFQLLEFGFEQIINFRQRKIYKTTTEVPLALIGLTKRDTFEKARVYALEKAQFGLVSDFYDMIIGILLLACNGFVLIWTLSGKLLVGTGLATEDNEIAQGAAFIVLFSTISTIIKLPFSVYYTFVLEEKHGFNKQTVAFYIKDKIKQYLLMVVMSVLIGSAITYIVKVGGDYFFIYLWMFFVAVTLFLMTIYPSVIAPLFDKYTPLPEGPLRTEIEKLAQSIQFPLTELYIVEGSKRSAHSNAYFYGFYKNKRIVLFDTLLKGENEDKEKGCSDSEILAVLGHELGHWKLNHVLKNMIVLQVNMLITFAVFAALIKCRLLYAALGFTSMPVLVGLLVLTQYVMAPYFFVHSWISAYMSRQYEFDADNFAKELGRCHALKAALIKLNSDNLGFPIYDKWYSSLHNSHPPLLERIEALDKPILPIKQD